MAANHFVNIAMVKGPAVKVPKVVIVPWGYLMARAAGGNKKPDKALQS